MYKSGLYQLGAGINQIGGGNNYNLLGYPVGYYTNTGLSNMVESVSRPILSVNQYLSGGAPSPMYSIGSGEEPFILDDIQGGKKKKKGKKNALIYPTLRGGDKAHLKKMKSLLKDLEKHRDNKTGIDTIIKKHKSMLEGMGYKSDMKGAGFFDWVNSWLPDALGAVPIFGSVLKPVATTVRDTLYGMNETEPEIYKQPYKPPPPLNTDIPKPTQQYIRKNPYSKRM